MVKLHLGNNIDILKQLEENSIDSVVTDPPYGLSEHKPEDTVACLSAWLKGEPFLTKKKGFMGNSWDAWVPGPELWKEVYRVLKPGGHILVFAGTRSMDLMAIAIRLAGFEMRDSIGYAHEGIEAPLIAWVYGCLSEDTEILTTNGWKRYHTSILQDNVICYNIETDTFEICKPEKKFIYENKHTAYRIKSDKTDQIVTRDHRVLIERKGNILFERAEQLEWEPKTTIPILESLSDLPKTIYDRDTKTSIKKQDLLKKVQRQINIESKDRKGDSRREKKINKSYLYRVWQRVLQTNMSCKSCRESLLFSPMQWKSKRQRMEKTCTQRKSLLDSRKRETIKRKNDWKYESSMEGWGDLQKSKRIVSKIFNKICKMSRTISKYVSQGWVRDGTQIKGCTSNWKTLDTKRMCSSYKPQSRRQQIGEFNVIQNKSRPQKLRSRKTYRTTMATVEPIEYTGKVWCIQVPTGAFVARRNGKIFITGNSGFPKSHDISKAIDKEAGNKREIINTIKKKPSASSDCNPGWVRPWAKDKTTMDITAPASELSEKWDGWGTALKPAWEPIILARKPLSEKTVAQNVIKWGTGSINIDGCRVETKEELRRTVCGFASNSEIYHNDEKYKINTMETNEPKGRWPANVVLDDSDEVQSLFPEVGSGVAGNKSRAWGTGGDVVLSSKEDGVGWKAYGSEGYNDSGSAARFFYSAKASKKERNEGLEGEEKNIHPAVKPVELCRYLCRLITPPDGVILDPFMGSGSTGVASIKEGFDFVGIELEETYYEIAEKRIAHHSNEEWQIELMK